MRGRFDALSHSWVTLVMNRALAGPLTPLPRTRHTCRCHGEQGRVSRGAGAGAQQKGISSLFQPQGPGFRQAGCPSQLQHKGSKEG